MANVELEESTENPSGCLLKGILGIGLFILAQWFIFTFIYKDYSIDWNTGEQSYTDISGVRVKKTPGGYTRPVEEP
jgi:hypothetical protein